MAIICSLWQAREPSAVTTVQPSASVRMRREPSVSIGSMQSTIPSRRSGPRRDGPKFGISGASCMSTPQPCPTYSRTMPSR